MHTLAELVVVEVKDERDADLLRQRQQVRDRVAVGLVVVFDRQAEFEVGREPLEVVRKPAEVHPLDKGVSCEELGTLIFKKQQFVQCMCPQLALHYFRVCTAYVILQSRYYPEVSKLCHYTVNEISILR